LKISFLVFDKKNYRGGPIVNIRRLSSTLAEKGHQIHILSYSMDGSKLNNLSKFANSFGIKLSLMPNDFKLTENRIEWILNTLAKDKPDIFVPNSYVCGFYAAKWIREAGIPTIGYFRSDDQFHEDLVSEFVLKQDEFSISAMICVAKSFKERLDKSSLPRTQSYFIPSGVPVPSQNSRQLNENGIGACYIGRFEEHQKKFKETTLALLRNLEKKIISRVGFIGDGTQRNWLLEEISNRNLNHLATWHGSVDPKFLNQTLQSYQVSVLLSDFEGTPGAVMDAMANGLVPIVSNNPDGTTELVEHEVSGMVVSDRRKGFDDALSRLSNDPNLRKKLAKNAKKKISEEYSQEKMGGDFEAICNKLIKDSDSSPKEILIPRKINLPPVKGSLAREDSRRTQKEALQPNSDFLNPKLSKSSLDTFWIRTQIKESLSKNLKNLNGKLLDVGAGDQPYRDFIISSSNISEYCPLDLENNDLYQKCENTWDGNIMPFSSNTFDSAIATEVLEHCPEPRNTLTEIFRVLKPGGFFFFTVPFIWPLHLVPHDEFRYTPFSLRRILKEEGFFDISVSSCGGWNATLAHFLGLWARRAGHSKIFKDSMSLLLIPLYKFLLSKDRPLSENYVENTMTPCFWGKAKKNNADLS
jgi:glycosyltransferase involved in cell wall biosynthesis/SAM-dependent methyltransferase